MASNFPASLDSFAITRSDATSMATTHAADHNNYADAINKIEASLGLKKNRIPNGVTDYGMVADNSTNNTPMLQAMINDIPQSGAGTSTGGGACYVPRGRYRFDGTVSLMDKFGIAIICEPGQSFNEDDSPPAGGTVFIGRTAGMTLFDCGSSGGVQHQGPAFLGNPHFFADASNITLLRLYSTNHWHLDRPNFQSTAAATGCKGVLLSHAGGSNDNAYGMFFRPTWTMPGASSIAVDAPLCNNYNMVGGNFNLGGGGTSYGLKLTGCSQCIHFGIKMNFACVGATRHVYCEGNSNEWIGCGFENPGNTWTVTIKRPLGSGPGNPSGYSNKFIGGNITGQAASRGIELINDDVATSNAYWNVIDIILHNLVQNVSVGTGMNNTSVRSPSEAITNPDTTGANITALETEVNEIKQALRNYGIYY
jgi:Pectate lyase superfamily protein